LLKPSFDSQGKWKAAATTARKEKDNAEAQRTRSCAEEFAVESRERARHAVPIREEKAMTLRGKGAAVLRPYKENERKKTARKEKEERKLLEAAD
jgi:hypothetical protein